MQTALFSLEKILYTRHKLEFSTQDQWGLCLYLHPIVSLSLKQPLVQTLTVDKGAFSLFAPHTHTKGSWLQPRDICVLMIHVSPQVLALKYPNSHLHVSSKALVHNFLDPVVQSIEPILSRYLDQPSLFPKEYISLLIESLVYHVFLKQAHYKEVEFDGEQGLTPYLERKIKAYIFDHYQENITLKSLSQMCGLSEAYFSRQFCKTFGKSFTDYLKEVRVEQAKMLLEETTLDVKQIALEVGYQFPTNFAKAFKQVTHVSPSAYRKTL